jgi:HSP20 family molecular chaperone IbpA
LVWLICQAALGRGKNKLLVRGIRGAEWVFCPLIKSVKNGRIGTDRCQRCQHFVRFEQTYIPKAQTTEKTLSFRTTALKSPFHVRKSLGRLKVPHPHIPSFPHIPSLIRQREPLIDTFEEGNNITVLAELPGVEEKDVNIITDERTIMITAENATKKYLKIVRLPTRIKKDTTKFTYRNNILQIRLKKQD